MSDEKRQSATPDLGEIERAAQILFDSSQIVEMRAFRGKQVFSGYYDDHKLLAAHAFQLAKRPDINGTYWTIQEIRRELIGRACNRYVERPENTTTDNEVVFYRWLPIDIDPCRPTGISASEEMKSAAKVVADSVWAFLYENGITTLCGDSGNGFHLLARVHMEATSENKALLQRVLAALAAKFSTTEARVDLTVFNPSRIWKIYGSVSRKGSDTSEFPHRTARLLALNGVPPVLPIVAREQLEEIARSQTAYSVEPAHLPQLAGDEAPLAIERDLATANITHGARTPYRDGYKWLLDRCVFDPSHVAPSVIITLAADGTRGFKCSHNSCVAKHWPDFQRKVGIQSSRLAIVEPERWATWQEAFHTVSELPEGDITFLIDQIMPEGISFTGALSGVGKTWFTLSMARALATGKKFLGVWNVPEPVHVIYLCPEMNAKAFRKRCERFGMLGCDHFRCMTISDGAPIDLSSPLLAAAIKELRPVVFLDTAIRFSAAQDENSASENAKGLARGVFRMIHLGARAIGCNHHRSKETARAEVEMTLENVLRGTGDFGAMTDVVFGLQIDRSDSSKKYAEESRKLVRLEVRCVKARDFIPVRDFRVQLDPFLNETGDLGLLAPQDFDALDRAESERVGQVLSENPRISQTQAAARCGVTRRHLLTVATRVGFGWDERAKLWRLGKI